MLLSSHSASSYLLVLLLTCLLFACHREEQPAVPQTNAVLSGTVLNRISGTPVAGAVVGMCYHETEMLREGLWIGGTDCAEPEVLAYTLDDGRFQLPLLADTTGLPTYVWVRVVHPDYETMHEVYVPVSPGENAFGEMAMRGGTGGHSAGKGTKVSNRKSVVAARKGEVFPRLPQRLKALYPAEHLKRLPSIADRGHGGQYVRFAAPVRGYNPRPATFRTSSWDAWHTLLLPMEIAVAGVVEGEVGLFTTHPEALKTQAVWARTYALYKGLNEGLPQNFQLAFSTTLAESSRCASQETEGKVLSHVQAPGGMGFPLMAVFSARCNGDFTQSGQSAKWSGCELGGNWNPYLLPVECSKHANCKDSGLGKPCCNIDPFWSRYLFGHGAGGCQQGMKDFAEGNYPGGARGLSYSTLAPYYFYGSRLVSFYGDVWSLPKPPPRGAGN